MSFNAQRQKNYASTVVALNTFVAGTITSAAALVLAPGEANRIAPGGLYMHVSAGLTTSTIVATTIWQASDDGTNWYTLYPSNGAAYVNVAAAGSGGLVTTAYRQFFDFGDPCAFQYLRGAVKNTVVTGGAGDNVTIYYGWIRRFFIAN